MVRLDYLKEEIGQHLFMLVAPQPKSRHDSLGWKPLFPNVWAKIREM